MHKAVFWRHLAVLGGYILLTILMTWPAVTSLQNSVLGTGGDPWQTMWRLQEKATVLTEAKDAGNVGAFLREEFLGGGEARLVNLAVWPWMWLYLLVGLPLSYNLIWLLTFVLAGYGMYLFARDIGFFSPSANDLAPPFIREAPAFLAGLYFMFLPFHVAHAQGHFGAMQLQWLPLIGWAALRLYRTRHWGWAVALGLLLSIQAWTEHHYMLWLVIFAIVTAIFWRREVKSFLVRRFGWLITILLTLWCMVAIVLPYYPTIRLAQEPASSLSLGEEQTVRFSSDLFAFVLPASFHPVWGRVFGTIFTDKFTGNVSEATQYLGVGALLLLLFFHGHIPRRQKLFWLLVGGVFLLISLGPYLHVFGHVLPLPLPYALVQSWPVLSAVRAVGRAGALVGLSSAVLLFWVLRTQLHRRESVAAVAAVLLLDFLFLPVPRQSAVLPAVYDELSAAPGSRVIEIPAATNYAASSRALFASHTHGKELLGDIALERADTSELELVKSVPGIRQLLYLRTTELRRDRSEFFAQALPESLADAMTYFDVGAIIIHTDSVSALQLSSMRSFLEEDMRLVPTTVDDALLYVVDLPTLPVAGDGVFLTRDGRWSGVGYDPKRESVFAEIETEASVTLVNVGDEEKEVVLTATVFSDSLGQLVVKDESGVVISQATKGETMAIPLTVLKGKHPFSFMASGGKVVIQNPVMTVR